MGNYLTAPFSTNTPLNATKVTLIPNIEVGSSSADKEQQNVIAKDFCNVEVNIPGGITINSDLAQEIISKLAKSDETVIEQLPEERNEPEEPKPVIVEEPKPTIAQEEKILEVPLPTGPKSKKKKGKKHH